VLIRCLRDQARFGSNPFAIYQTNPFMRLTDTKHATYRTRYEPDCRMGRGSRLLAHKSAKRYLTITRAYFMIVIK
jgi:hypothetical protein